MNLIKDEKPQEWHSAANYHGIFLRQLQQLLRIIRIAWVAWGPSDARLLLQINDLPSDVLGKIIGLLPLKARARVESVCKLFCKLSLERITEAEFQLAPEDGDGLACWLNRLSRSTGSSLQALRMRLSSKYSYRAWDLELGGIIIELPASLSRHSQLYCSNSSWKYLRLSVIGLCHHNALTGWFHWEVWPALPRMATHRMRRFMAHTLKYNQLIVSLMCKSSGSHLLVLPIEVKIMYLCRGPLSNDTYLWLHCE